MQRNSFRSLKRVAAIVVVVTILLSGVVTPKPAHAVDTTILIIGSIVAYAVTVITLAWLVYRKPASAPDEFMAGPPDGPSALDPVAQPVHFMHRCRQDGGLTVACW